VLSRVEVRTVAQDYTVRWAGAAYQIRRSDIGGGMRGKQVAVQKPDAAERLRRRQQARARYNEACQRLPERPVWQAARS
jgi:hypothetical protein